jgi:hypothetical protein
MAESPTYADAGDEVPGSPSPDSTSRTPRWVKLFGLVALAVVLLIGALMLFGGGNHGPGRHLGGDTPSGDAGRNTPPAGAPESGGHTGPPPGIEH